MDFLNQLFGEQNVRYLFHGRGIFVYRLIVCAFLVLGAVTHVNLVLTSLTASW